MSQRKRSRQRGGTMTTGEKLKAAREAAKLSQSELASRAGVQLRQIQRWESDEDEPKVHAFKRAALALGRRMEDLIGEEDGA